MLDDRLISSVILLQLRVLCTSTVLAARAQVWLTVQRKWMYLEGIFLAGDIRSQLPEEAKRFDTIDKLFKKVLASSYKCNVISTSDQYE